MQWRICKFILGVLVVVCADSVFAQVSADYISGADEEKHMSVDQLQHINVKSLDKNEFVIAPIPFLNPSQGWGLALVGQYIFKTENDNSPPSIVGGGAFYTEKHSFGGALAYSGKLANDDWRVGLAVGKVTLFYDFYGIGYDQNNAGISVPVKQDISFTGVRLMKHITEKIFLGLELVGAEITAALPDGSLPAGYDSDVELKNDFVSPNLKIERDSRDDSFYPTTGSLFDLSAAFHSPELHDATTYQVYKLSYNHYFSIADMTVFAFRVMTNITNGTVPFYSLSMFGAGGDLRGYETGKYRDKMMWATQGELRHRFTDRWGAVAFAGAGQVARTFPDFQGSPYLCSGGLGLRFRIAKKNPVDFRFDTAYGDEKISYYFSVGQAF